MKIRIYNEDDRMRTAAVLVKNGYRVEQSKEQRKGKKTVDYFLVVEDVREKGGEKE